MTQSVEDFREQLREILRSAEIAAHLRTARARVDGVDGDIRPLYRALGDAGVLATPWPPELGGRGADVVESVVLLEELTRHGVPTSLHYITVHIVGTLLLHRGTPEQQQAHLPGVARGERHMCILFTEPDTGSDLGAVACAARRSGAGWVLDGGKRYNLKTTYADHALVLVRTDEDVNRYRGLTLVLVPLDSPGVVVDTIPTMTGEHFHDVAFTGVEVGPEAVVGAPGAGWAVVSELFTAERNGLDYYARGLHWLESARSVLRAQPPDETAPVVADLARLWARLDTGRLLSSEALRRLREGRADVASASLAKWHCSETAQRIGWWAHEALDLLDADEQADVLAAAHLEAPSLTIAGGASEVLLEMIAGARLLDGRPA